MEESKLIQDYLHAARTEERLHILQSMRDSKVNLPISLSADLMKLKLNGDELISILRTTSAKQKLAFEDYLSSQLTTWDQNVASAALWEWATRTDCIMWHRTLPLSLSSHTPQRMRYTLLDLAWFGGGFPLIERIAAMEGVEDMSAAFTSLLCFRALQFGVESPTLLELAKKNITASYQTFAPADKTLPYYLAYLFRFDTEWVRKQKVHQGFSGIWSQFLNASKEERRWQDELKIIQGLSSRKAQAGDDATLLEKWPSLWQRKHISAEVLQFIFEQLASGSFPLVGEQSWEFFAGIPRATMSAMLQSCPDPKVLATAFNVIGSFLDYGAQDTILQRLRDFLQKSDNPSELLTHVSPRYSALLNSKSATGANIFDRIFEERELTLKSFAKGESAERAHFGLWDKELPAADVDRRNFFLIAYHGKSLGEIKGEDFWPLLSKAWQQPTAERIEAISQKARQAPHLFQICFIDTLGRFKGNDTAALKLLDFIRSNEDPVLRSVMYALQGIGTVRASQELVAFLTRPNISPNLQLEISNLLKELDVSHLQPELRSALNDLNYRAMTDSLLLELRDAISSLLVIEEPIKSSPSPVAAAAPPTTAELDKLLARRIAAYDTLSSEVKRALRTAQFFHLQVEQVRDQLGTIDLSPAIDMQYKALEICFREKFEFPCSEVIRQGVLQRKLDVIGYARPIPSAMDDYENYIEGLPIINTIPFFSRFKLRKMLRAICQYRPGKRFTLDGLKAFAIFFICFSRQDCRYGLAQIFPIATMNNEQLLNFCKQLHIFQDFRNRAAHEGFHPDASNNLDSIWDSTASIIEGMMLIAEGLENNSAPRLGIVRKIG